MSRSPTVAVIGAGFSGLLTALRLLTSSREVKVRLVERRRFGLGAAYSTTSPGHLLNVRAANMSAFSERPTHFLDWLRERSGSAEPPSFVTRAEYGAYLQGLLRKAAGEPSAAGRLILEADEAVALKRRAAGWRIEMAMGRSFAADAVVLAVGNPAPRPVPGLSPAALASSCYVADPWRWDVSTAPEDGTAILIGSGLTMVDVALNLSGERPGLKLLALSRRGLAPRRHAAVGQVLEFGDAPFASPRAVLRQVRRAAAGRDWREVVDGLRPHVQAIWRAWPVAERKRFLRHVRPWWDVHRHRLAPAVASRLDHLTGSGVLRVQAGGLAQVEAADHGLDVAWLPRGGKEVETTAAVLLINCTGPAAHLDNARDPLISGLAGEGLIRTDGCGLGMDVDEQSRAIGRDGAADSTLFAVGPITRGSFWEITSVPDIRLQATDCAARVLQAIASAKAA